MSDVTEYNAVNKSITYKGSEYKFAAEEVIQGTVTGILKINSYSNTAGIASVVFFPDGGGAKMSINLSIPVKYNSTGAFHLESCSVDNPKFLKAVLSAPSIKGETTFRFYEPETVLAAANAGHPTYHDRRRGEYVLLVHEGAGSQYGFSKILGPVDAQEMKSFNNSFITPEERTLQAKTARWAAAMEASKTTASPDGDIAVAMKLFEMFS